MWHARTVLLTEALALPTRGPLLLPALVLLNEAAPPLGLLGPQLIQDIQAQDVFNCNTVSEGRMLSVCKGRRIRVSVEPT